MLKKIIILIIVSITIKAQSELFISEYLEGSGNNKAIEIYNPQNVTVDLSNYRVTRWNNGGTSTSMDTIRLLHQLSPNDVYVIADSAAEQDILSQADTTSTITFFNGDDYLALQKFDGTNWIDIDVFGEATGVDPGDAWPVAGTPSATREHTLIRKSNISYGTTDWAESAGTDSVNSQWLVYPQDTFIFLGAHPGTNSTANPEPSEYPTNFIANAPSTTVTLIWDDALGTQLPDGYLLIGYDISHYINPPIDGVEQNDDVDFSDGIGVLNINYGIEYAAFPDLEPNTNYHFEIYPYSNEGVLIDYKTDGVVPQLDIQTGEELSTIFYEDFEAGFSSVTIYDVAGLHSWTYMLGGGGANNTNGYAEINGYPYNDERDNDWLILPAFNFSVIEEPTLSFFTKWKYGQDGELSLFYSEDYIGSGDPSLADWFEIPFDSPISADVWTEINLDLSFLEMDNVHIAFNYLEHPPEMIATRRWDVDEIRILGIQNNPLQLTIREIQETSDGEEGDSPLNGETVQTSGIVTAASGSSYFLQDAPGAWNGVYVYSPGHTAAIGDSVTVVATVTEYNGLTELIAVEDYMVHSTGNSLPEATYIDNLSQANSEKWESVLISVSGECNNSDLGFGEWSIEDITGSLIIDDLFYGYQPTIGYNYNITAPLFYAFGSYKLEPRDSSDIIVDNLLSIYEIQYLSPEILLNPPYDGASLYEGDTVTVSGVVMVSPYWYNNPDSGTTLIQGAPAFYLQDILNPEFGGIICRYPGGSGEAFNNLDTGYVVNVTGVVEEYFQTTHLNLIEFKPEDIVDFVGRPHPIQLTLDSLNEIGTSNPNYLAEKWEHCYVELRNVTVSHAYSFGSGTYVIYDENGTKILVGNKSSFWRTYPIPEHGTKIDKIRGFIENRNNIDEYWFIINPVYPSDIEIINSIEISLPINEEVTYNTSNTTIEIPITTESLTDQDVISYQFTIEYDPSLVDATGINVDGTLSNQSGWSVLPNTLVDGEITVGAFGANPLSGEGEVIKVVFEMTGVEGTTPLHFRDFVFNSGDPMAITTDGSINIVLGMCGDANEDQQIYAQDAAFTLQHSIGLIELTAQGANNADVNMDGSATAFDAALILRYVIGLPEPVATCFEEGGKKEGSISLAGEEELSGFNIYGSKIEEKEGGERKEIEMEYGGIEGVAGIYSISYEVEIKEGRGEVWIEKEGEGYMVEINRVDEKRVRVGIINGKGISSEEIRMKIGMRKGEEVEEIEISKIEINGIEKEGMTLTNLVSGLEVTEYRLVGSYPNPFNPSTKVVYEIPENAKVNIIVYDILGRKITELVNAEMEKGRHEIEWRGINNHNERVSSGTYIIMMRTSTYQKAIKVNLLK